MQGLVSKPTAIAYSGALAIALSQLVMACGDDDAPVDAGGMDAGGAGRGSNRPDGGFIRPPDAQVTTGDPIPACDRWDPGACTAGQRCHLLIRLAAGAQDFVIYTGCIDDSEARAEGDPCDPWNGGSLPYKTEGLEDEVHVDPCSDGLVCAPDSNTRGLSTCQRACESGVMSCGSQTEYCAGDPQGLEQFCRASDGCDPSDPTVCGPGSGCYLRPNERGDGFLTVCAPTSEMPVADGLPCQFVNDCNPGSTCWSPAREPPALWDQNTEIICHRACRADAEGSPVEEDAGTDDDAGVGGGCRSSQICQSFSEAGLELGDLPDDLGQCE